MHGRAAALEGPDGLPYSLEVLTDETGDAVRPHGAFLVFLQWRRVGEPGVAGHLESEFVAYADSAQEAINLAGDTPLAECQRLLDALVIARDGDSGRRWFDAMRDEDGE